MCFKLYSESCNDGRLVKHHFLGAVRAAISNDQINFLTESLLCGS